MVFSAEMGVRLGQDLFKSRAPNAIAGFTGMSRGTRFFSLMLRYRCCMHAEAHLRGAGCVGRRRASKEITFGLSDSSQVLSRLGALQANIKLSCCWVPCSWTGSRSPKRPLDHSRSFVDKWQTKV